jgi:hypothetical protein
MKNTETHNGNTAGFPRMMFIIALLVTLGAAFAALQTSQPVREAFGLEPIIDGLPPRTLWTRGVSAADVFSPTAASVRHESTIVRTLDTGTQRARLLELAELSHAGALQPTSGLTAMVAAADIDESSAESFTE